MTTEEIYKQLQEITDGLYLLQAEEAELNRIRQSYEREQAESLYQAGIDCKKQNVPKEKALSIFKKIGDDIQKKYMLIELDFYKQLKDERG